MMNDDDDDVDELAKVLEDHDVIVKFFADFSFIWSFVMGYVPQFRHPLFRQAYRATATHSKVIVDLGRDYF